MWFDQKTHVPPKFTSLPMRVTGTFLSLAFSLSWKNEFNFNDERGNVQQQWREGDGVDTTCLCCLKSGFLALLALSMSSDVRPPTVELSWLNNLVCPENIWCDQSRWHLSRLVLDLPLHVPRPPVKQVLKQADDLRNWAAAALCAPPSCRLRDAVSWRTKYRSQMKKLISRVSKAIINSIMTHYATFTSSGTTISDMYE